MPFFFFFALTAFEFLGPCHWRQVLQHAVHCWTNGACARLMCAHPSVIIFGSLDWGWFLLVINRIVCTACVYVCVHKKAQSGFFCIYWRLSSRYYLYAIGCIVCTLCVCIFVHKSLRIFFSPITAKPSSNTTFVTSFRSFWEKGNSIHLKKKTFFFFFAKLVKLM